MSNYQIEEFPEDFRKDFEKYRNIPFNYKSWNCLHLAKQLHEDYFSKCGWESKFPDVIDKFKYVKEEEASIFIATWIPIYCRRVSELSNGALVILDDYGNNNLSSYYDGMIYYMVSLGVKSESPEKLSMFIKSIWEII